MAKVFFVIALLLSSVAAGAQVKDDEQEDIGYTSVRAALEDLRKQPGATLTIQGEWNVISNPKDNARILWSFTQPTHYAFPAVAKREVLDENGAPYVDTTLLCEASKEACDQLFIDFQSLDKSLSERMKADSSAKATATN